MQVKSITFIFSFAFILALFLIITSCASDEDTISSQGEYAKAQPLSSSQLIMPPGLTEPEASSTYRMIYNKSNPNSYELGKLPDMSIVAGGAERWLVIKNKNVNQVFPLVVSFLKQQNLRIKYQNVTIGLIQTDWFDESDADKGGVMSQFLGWIGLARNVKAMPSLYNFRINLWQNGNDIDVFVTDYQINAALELSGKAESSIWVSVPPSPQIELDFLTQFMAFIKFGSGVIELADPANHDNVLAKVSNVARDKMLGDTIMIYDTFDQAWWRTSIALERAGLGVADKNRSAGEFYVYQLQNDITNKDPGSFKRMFGDDTTSVAIPKPKYIVKLKTEANVVQLTFDLYPKAIDKDFTKNKKKYLDNLAKQLK